MRIAILESIVMPAGHEVEFDRILVEELKKQGFRHLGKACNLFYTQERYEATQHTVINLNSYATNQL